MKQKAFQFFISAFSYWLVASFAGNFLQVPEKIITLAVFIPPIFGLMWGFPAAVGVYVGGIFAMPEINNLFSANVHMSDWISHFVRGIWVFLAGYLQK